MTLNEIINLMKAVSPKWNRKAGTALIKTLQEKGVISKKEPHKMIELALMTFKKGVEGHDEMIDIRDLVKYVNAKRLTIEKYKNEFAKQMFTPSEFSKLASAKNQEEMFSKIIENKYSKMFNSMNDKKHKINNILRPKKLTLNYKLNSITPIQFDKLNQEQQLKMFKKLKDEYESFFKNKSSVGDLLEEYIDKDDSPDTVDELDEYGNTIIDESGFPKQREITLEELMQNNADTITKLGLGKAKINKVKGNIKPISSERTQNKIAAMNNHISSEQTKLNFVKNAVKKDWTKSVNKDNWKSKIPYFAREGKKADRAVYQATQKGVKNVISKTSFGKKHEAKVIAKKIEKKINKK